MKVIVFHHKRIFMKNYLIISCIFLISCTAKKGVSYDEMSNVLVAKYKDGKLILHTGNSKNHSAYLIYDVQAKADNTNKTLFLTAFQAPKKENKDHFEIDLKKLGVINITEYKIIWVDPDGKNTNVQLQKNE